MTRAAGGGGAAHGLDWKRMVCSWNCDSRLSQRSLGRVHFVHALKRKIARGAAYGIANTEKLRASE